MEMYICIGGKRNKDRDRERQEINIEMIEIEEVGRWRTIKMW